MPVGRTVVVVGGGLVGLELAEFLAERGRTVTVLEAGDKLGTEMAHPRRARAIHEARSHGVTLVTGATLTAIGADTVTFTVGDETRTAPAAHVIFATGVHGDTRLADALRDRGLEVHVVGDAGEVGYIQNAVATGNAVGRSV
jgi:NADPH-dependent 2,4-dienoyl-CoA reductase/sulfur reductase-like enzyme